MNTSIKNMQTEVDNWVKNVGGGYFSELSNLAQLTEEVGELARVINRTFGNQNYKPTDQAKELSEEIGDVLFVLTCLANQTGVDLEKAFAENMAKKNSRDSERFKK